MAVVEPAAVQAPVVTVLRDTPAASATAVRPPRPSSSAAAPSTSRFCRSSSNGTTREKNSVSPSLVTFTTTLYNARVDQAGTPSVDTFPKIKDNDSI